jgi:hypothetical protein
MIRLQRGDIVVTFSKKPWNDLRDYIDEHATMLIAFVLGVISITAFLIYYFDKLGLAYNDARSHLDIARRVVEGLTPGFAQLGSVWLPLPHLLMVPTVWNDFFWHTGLSGAIQSMAGFVITGILIYSFLKMLNVGLFGRLFGVFVFVANINILYLQSTAMTELLLLVTMTAGVYELLLWERTDNMMHFIKMSFFIMLATLVRYDGWFLFLFASGIIALLTLIKKGYKVTEGRLLFFFTLAGFGIVLWVLWNLAIFHDPLYFIYGPYSAHTQQEQLLAAGNLATKGNMMYSIKTYIFALAYNSNTFILLLSIVGMILLAFDKRIKMTTKLVLCSLLAPLFFNILALYMGQSVLFIAGIDGNTWFNVRYGIMMMPSIAIFIGYLVHRLPKLRIVMVGLILMITGFTFLNQDAVTIDDARVGSSQKNVTEVSSWLNHHAKDKDGYVLISVASHDAIVFSSGLPMGKFIHEGTGDYWKLATANPDHWARWIIMRTNDESDQTFKLIHTTPGFAHFKRVESYPFADIYELKPQYLSQLRTNIATKVTK